MLKIEDLRLTFIWIETFFDLLNAANETVYPLGFMGFGYAYKEEVGKLLAPQPTASGLSLPWKKPAGNLFWTRYLEDNLPGHIKPAKAWDKLIPLRSRPPILIEPKWAKQKAFCEGYYYPFGIALGISVYVSGDYTLKEAIAQAHLAYKNGLYNLKVGGQPAAGGHLGSIALTCLEYLRHAALDPAQAAGSITPTPLTISTVVRGEGVDKTLKLADNPERETIQRALEALSNWQPNYDTVILPPLDDRNVVLDSQEKKKSPGDLLYAGKGANQGRAVWFPGRFTDPNSNAALACYHRNLVIGTLHTESLARFAQRVLQQYPNESYKNAPNLRWCAQKAGKILGDLFIGKDRDTYRSGSLQAQIEKGGHKAAINQLLLAFGEAALP